MIEEWRSIAGWEGHYEVSSEGRVRSLTRTFATKQGTRTKQGRILAQYLGDNYAKVRLAVDYGGKTYYVHRLVAEAFIGQCPPGHEVCHDNGRAQDNRAANLRYDTRLENMRDIVRHGRHFHKNQTQCKHGHEFTPENTAYNKRGYRRCRACARLRWVPRRQRQAAA